VETANEMVAYLGQRLMALGLGDAHPSIGDIRRLGLFWAVDLVRNRAREKSLLTQ
jgi:taurine---2-oxoglutarate transaminase